MQCASCRFFEWIDPPMCARLKVIIPSLLQRLRKIKEDKEKQYGVHFVLHLPLEMDSIKMTNWHMV